MTETYVLPGINVYQCSICSRKGNNVFISVTLKRFYDIMLYGPRKVPGVCKACGRTSLIELMRPAPPPRPDTKELSRIIKQLLR